MNFKKRSGQFIAKLLVILMTLQGMPLWQLSRSYTFEFQTKKIERLFELISFLSPASAEAADPEAQTVGFEETFIRGKGTPFTETRVITNLCAPATIRLLNGGIDEQFKKVSSAVVTFNDEVLFTHPDFNQKIRLLQKEVNPVDGDNILTIKLLGKPGGAITLQILQADSDGDGFSDCSDACPDDPDKTAPGACGCGAPDIDLDEDGTPDCIDNCPDDPNKIEPGICECGLPDTDTDNDGTPDCTDLCLEDPDKVQPDVCGCGIPDTDQDGDGIPDCNDLCTNDPDKTEPGICGCGVAETDFDGDDTPDCIDDCPNDSGKTSPGECGCGTSDIDTDGDNTPDCNDLCPDDPDKNEPGICGCGIPDIDTDSDGTPDCNDTCPNDPDKIEPGVCGCGILDTDLDGDGTPDCNDLCPDDPDKTDPGGCGCGIPDTDIDGDGTPDCIDNCPEDSSKTDPGGCGCGTPDIDSDGDGTLDCNDLCPGDPNKTDPGVCGCGIPDTDTDSDGTPDCNDTCPNDPDKINPGVCGCSIPDADLDGDGEPDCLDLCPADPDKSDPGICGCGTPDIDSDTDGTPDCIDNCPDDSNKTEPGTCGCGVPDIDSDEDETLDCNDLCPEDPVKIDPGVCGCGTPDMDSDGDGTFDCNDPCPDDPEKIDAGVCGCGVSDTDTDEDGTPDCNDLCPGDPGKTDPGVCGCGVPDTDSDGDGTPDCIDAGDPPLADAGEDAEYIIAPGASTDVILDGTGSTDPDGTIVSYTWTGLPDPEDVVQPTVNLSAGLYTFTLLVTDNNTNDSDPDTVTITVTESAENIAPSITSMPLTIASVDYEYVYPVIANDPNGDTMTCSLLNCPEGMTVNGSAVVRWTPTAGQVADHQVSLQVDDGTGGIDTQTFWIRVTQGNSETSNRQPIAHAGDEITVDESSAVELDGTNSFDADGNHLSFLWTQTEGPAVELDNYNSPQPAFTAPEVDTVTTISFELIVNDGTIDSNPASVSITLLNIDIIPDGVVTNSNDSGPGSLRAAVEYANSHPGTHITFSIPDTDPSYNDVVGVWSLLAPQMNTWWYIYITGDGTFLDGNTQTENWGDRNPFGPEIEIYGGYYTMGINADNVVIRGLVLNRPNGSTSSISVLGGTNIVIISNYIGTDPTGTQARNTVNCSAGVINPKDGIRIGPNPVWGGHIGHVRIGGSSPGEGNLISGMQFRAISIETDVGKPFGWVEGNDEIDSVTIQGNIIGPDRTGTVNLVDCGGMSMSSGIHISYEKADILLGGVTPGSRNIISGWSVNIYLLSFAGRMRVQGNYIGTDISGSFPIPPTNSSAYGIGLIVYSGLADYPAEQVLIGGSEPGAGNLISGNPVTGLTLRDASQYLGTVEAKGNFIGTDPTGTSAIPNGSRGIYLWGRVRAQIGGSSPGEGNIISGNNGWGIYFDNRWPSPYAFLYGNKIGIGADGVTPLPNVSGGIYVGHSPGCWIGSNEVGAGNIIAYNGGHGIYFPWDMNDYGQILRGRPIIRGNSIFANDGLGITRDGSVQPNDPGDANLFTFYIDNYPEIMDVQVENGMTMIQGILDTYKPYNCQIELFANSTADPTGYGEGERWLVSLYPDTDGNFEITCPEDLSGFYLTATSTRMILDSGDPSARTSDFSPAVFIGDSTDTNLPPEITSFPDGLVLAEDTYQYQVIASDPEGDEVTYSLAFAPDGMSIDSSGFLTWLPTTAQEGSNGVTIVVRDTLGLYTSQHFTISVMPLVDLDPPTISIPLPEMITIDSPYDLIGTVYDSYLRNYLIEMAPAGSDNWILMDEGAENVMNDYLGMIDTTRLANGLYDLRVVAFDETGWVSIFGYYDAVEVTGHLKVGQFSLGFQDIIVPLAGIPISVIRNYNSFDKEQGDFGIGWDMTMASGVKLQVTRILGEEWWAEEDYCFMWGPTGCLAWVYELLSDNVPKVLITYADGRQDRFEFTPDFSTQPALDPDYVTASFTALEGTTSSLEAVQGSDLLLIGGTSGDTLYDLDIEVFDPDLFRLTTDEGMVLIISEDEGLKSITDPNGNTITFTPSGITHSSGLSITMDRDAEGRITRINDPMGYEVSYVYNGSGDLVEFTDKESNLTQFGYDENHNLISIIDPRGIEILQVEYDEDGRMIGTIDGLGNPTDIFHDMENAIEYITDRNGNTSAYEYDTDGNIISETDPLGNVTDYIYDGNRNKLSETDPLGNITSWTYDDRDNKLSENDPLGNTTYWTYNSQNQILSTTDPLGNVTSNTYDGNGNLITKTDVLGSMVEFTYDASGNQTSMIDCDGNVWTYTYDIYGNKLTETDPLGNVSSYTYDSNGNMLTKTDALGNVTTKGYDNLGNLISTLDPIGNTFTAEYDANSKKIAEVDKLGNRTEFEYDENGNLIQTTYPDGTIESNTFDANDNRITFTDKSGRMTHYQYDAGTLGESPESNQNRLISIIYPDSTTTTFEYDALGRITATIDENGNRTESEYDTAGRAIRIIDALANHKTFAYDANGNQTIMNDANGNTTTYEYDALNRQIRTIFPDGTSSSVEYTASCCSTCKDKKVSETDQAGNTTLYEYDPLDRLIRVVDAMGGITSYTYDAVGDQLTQTDANTNTTSFTYDSMKRVLTHMLPMGQSESFTYDANDNVLSKTDFNGDTTTYTYDVINRLTLKQYPTGPDVSYTYTPAGKQASVTDARGITSHTYDDRDRLLTVTHPDSSVISYTYDSKGNRTSVTVPSGTTTYSYDALNRLSIITAPDSGITTYTYDNAGNRVSISYPNNTVTEYTYNSLNRLTYIENRTSAVGPIISSYEYVLGAAGNRMDVTEESGRVVNYNYDSLYRLTQEQITDSALGNQTISYTYDPVGNRLTKIDPTGTTTYNYNANDHLTTETASSQTNTYLYDLNGNTLSRSDGTVTTDYTYDYENRLIEAQTGASIAAYIYDTDGIRVNSDTDGNVINFIVDKNRPFAQVLEERDGTNSLIVRYAYGDDLISQTRGTSTSYYLTDGQLSIRQLTNASADVTDTYVFDAFGILIDHTGTTENNYLYTGEQYDPNIGFYYLRARYLNTKTGRFLTHDPLLGNPFDPISLHRYLYASMDPVNFIDPSGQLEFSLMEMSVVSAMVGIITSIATYGVTGSKKAAVAMGVAATVTTFVLMTPFSPAISGGVLVGFEIMPAEAVLVSKFIDQMVIAIQSGYHNNVIQLIAAKASTPEGYRFIKMVHRTLSRVINSPMGAQLQASSWKAFDAVQMLFNTTGQFSPPP